MFEISCNGSFVNNKRAKIKSRCQYEAKFFIAKMEYDIKMIQTAKEELSGSVVECLTQDQGLQVRRYCVVSFSETLYILLNTG